MGSNYQEDHQSIVINSQEEVHETQYSSSDQENDDLGVGRSYECVFCKRGFNTAQALGGHMNIHRKDRARSRGSKPTATMTTTSDEYSDKHHLYTGPRLYQQVISPSSAANHHHHFAASHIHQDHHHLQPRLDMSSYYETAASTSSNTNRPFYIGNDEYYDGDYRQSSDPISAPADHNWRLSLSLDFSPMVVEDLEMSRPQAMNIQKEELDLELRLGYDH